MAQQSHDQAQFAALMEPVARFLLGEPNAHLSSKTELRYGSRGSLAVDLAKGVWHDHETGTGGGLLDLVQRETGCIEKQRLEWLDEHGFHVEREHAPRTNGRANGPTQFNIVKAYDYVDEEGEPLFQVCRLDPKDFRQRKRDPKGRDGWSWSVRGVRQVPYRLPELIEAIANDHTVFIVEGEKDVDNLWARGVPATCNAGGAGKWKEALNEFFDGADVVVIEDNDPQTKHKKTGELMFHPDGRPVLPGQDHAQAVAAALTGTAARVRVLKLSKYWPTMPLKGDVSDWLKDGNGTPEALYDIIEDVPTWSPDDDKAEQPAPALLVMIDITRWDGVAPPDRKWVVDGMIPARNVTLLTGQGGVGKTLLMQQLSVATVIARDWIGTDLSKYGPGPVIFITAEDDEDELHFRYDKIVSHYGRFGGVGFRDLRDLHLMSLAGKDSVMAARDAKGKVKPTELFEQLRRTAREIRPRWIGLDTAADIFLVDERDRAEVRQCISLLRGLALEMDTAVILLAHPSLTGIASGSGLSGSTAWNNSVRSRLYLKTPKKKDASDEDDDESAVRILEVMKSNYAISGGATQVRLVWKDGLLIPEPGQTPEARQNKDVEAQNLFMMLLDRYNKNDVPVSPNPSARNFAPKVFADLGEARALDAKDSGRKRLLRAAMDHLQSKERIYTGSGPRGVTKSRQSPCLYAAGRLL